jgi:uncharacterized protein (TIGR03086 family)
MSEDHKAGVARFQAATDTFDAKIHLVADDSWGNQTPCAEWDVRALVNHVVGEMAWVAPLMDGRTIADVGDTLDGDLLGTDPTAAWHHACAPACDAFSATGAMGSTVHLSYGDESAAGYCDQLTFDALVHAWDLARGAGLDDALPDDLVEWAIGWASPIQEMLTGSGLFGTPVAVADDVDQQTRLLAMVGRTR